MSEERQINPESAESFLSQPELDALVLRIKNSNFDDLDKPNLQHLYAHFVPAKKKIPTLMQLVARPGAEAGAGDDAAVSTEAEDEVEMMSHTVNGQVLEAGVNANITSLYGVSRTHLSGDSRS
jgi:hypothetical protein